jgi:hypothetical protein
MDAVIRGTFRSRQFHLCPDKDRTNNEERTSGKASAQEVVQAEDVRRNFKGSKVSQADTGHVGQAASRQNEGEERSEIVATKKRKRKAQAPKAGGKRQPPRPKSLANLPPGLKKYWQSKGVT